VLPGQQPAGQHQGDALAGLASLALAVLVELPLSALCLALAGGGIRRLTAAVRLTQPGVTISPDATISPDLSTESGASLRPGQRPAR
jgi:hypothetical protein